jgi:beta-N-acetylhexosaminidase
VINCGELPARKISPRADSSLPIADDFLMNNSFQTLSLEQQIGQLLFIGLPGKELDGEARALLDEIQPGGVILFARNVGSRQQLRALTDEIRAALSVAPLIGLDQEGGAVDRLRKVLTPMPSARQIAQSGDVENARALGRIRGEALRIFGFNMNFAPVVDVVTAEREKFNAGLHTRVFGATPETVSQNARAYLEALQKAGILGCLKHFPGLGAGAVDSHHALPRINLSRAELMRVDVAPFARLIEARIAHCVMIGHAVYTSLEEAGGASSPASLSPKIIGELLRGELNFQELVVTDDLEMGAILKNYTIAEAARRAVRAGNDMLLICARADFAREAHQTLARAAREGDLNRARLQESLARIAAFKNLTAPPLPFDNARLDAVVIEIETLKSRLP